MNICKKCWNPVPKPFTSHVENLGGCPGDSEKLRNYITHGWAFTDLHPDVVEVVKAYLEDGDPDHLEGTTYADLRKVLAR